MPTLQVRKDKKHISAYSEMLIEENINKCNVWWQSETKKITFKLGLRLHIMQLAMIKPKLSGRNKKPIIALHKKTILKWAYT